jgi:outer membrane cobalamin receptor
VSGLLVRAEPGRREPAHASLFARTIDLGRDLTLLACARWDEAGAGARSLRASLSTAARTCVGRAGVPPALGELYYPYGNPALEAEHSRSA